MLQSRHTLFTIVNDKMIYQLNQMYLFKIL